MKRGRFAAAIIPVLAAWAVALAFTGGTAMAAASHRAPGHTAAAQRSKLPPSTLPTASLQW